MNGILFASQEIKSVGFSWTRGPRQKDLGLEGCGRRMSDTWSSEIQKFTYGVIFQSLICWKLNELKKVKRTGWILPSGRKLPYRRLKNSLFELQSPPWFGSDNLGFGYFAGSGSNLGCFVNLRSNLWSGIFELRSDLESLFQVGFRVEVMFCSCAGYFQFWILLALGY